MVISPELQTPLKTDADPMVPRPMRIDRVQRETRDTFTLQLAPAGGFAFAPGQFNMLYVFGTGEVPISISGNPIKPERLVHTVRAVGPATKALQAYKRGRMIGVRGPFGTGWPVKEAEGKDLLIIAGGIGLAPLRPVVYQALAQRERFERVVLLYGARTREEILYAKEVERWRSMLDFDVDVTVDRAPHGWRGNVGVVTKLIAHAAFRPEKTVAMVCGPEIMMRFVILELQRRGISLEQLYVSMERNMKCAIGFCGHCQYGPAFICKNGPVFRYDSIHGLFGKREV